jgi:hypothetical protein
MGKKSTPAAPAAPDPVATANAQAGANTQAAITQANLNRIDQVTPDGSIRYSQIGTNSDGTPRYQQTQEYSPQQQALYNQQNQIAQSLGGLATNNIARVADAQSKPFTFDGMTPLQTSVQGGGLTFGVNGQQAQTAVPGAGAIQSTYGNGGNIQNSFAQPGALTSNVGGEFNGAAKAAADASYAQAASRLDPAFSQQENDFKARLANSGISENSDAYRRELDNFGRTKNDAYNQAAYSAQAAGLQAQNQGFQQGMQNAGLNNAAQGQQYQQNLGSAQFANQAQAQQNTQNAQAASFGNAAQDQQYNQNLSNAGFYNQGVSQNFNQAQQNAALNNTAQGQQFNQAGANASLNNAARQQQIQEASYLRNLPLNDIAALLGTGGGVQNPTFQNVAQVGVAAPDYQGAVYANYNAANAQYQQAQQARSQGLGSLFGLAGSLGSAAIMSDRRLKHNVRRIGTLASGIATYVYSYLGSTARQFGVMAQEVAAVRPDAVITLPSGYMAVDYRKVW